MNVSDDGVSDDGLLTSQRAELAATAGHTRFTEQVAGWVRAAVRRWAMGERISWDVALQLVPTQQGLRPFVVVYLTTPSPVLGELIGELCMVEPGQATDVNLHQVVGEAIQKLMATRRQAAASMNGHQ